MIIDLILDRQDGAEYSPRRFYDEVMDYGSIWPDIAYPIAGAMDCGTEEDVKRELCRYIDEQEYNPAIKDYINEVNWL